jgi:hypothetical protein
MSNRKTNMKKVQPSANLKGAFNEFNEIYGFNDIIKKRKKYSKFKAIISWACDKTKKNNFFCE